MMWSGTGVARDMEEVTFVSSRTGSRDTVVRQEKILHIWVKSIIDSFHASLILALRGT